MIQCRSEKGRGLSRTLRQRAAMMIVLASGLAPLASAADPTFKGVVLRVLDGDTLVLDLSNSGPTPIRLWGINAPELHEAGGAQATQVLTNLIQTEGLNLSCNYHHTDRYGRLVARCHTVRGTDLASHIVRSGAARDCARYSRGYYRQFETPDSVSLPTANFCHPQKERTP